MVAPPCVDDFHLYGFGRSKDGKLLPEMFSLWLNIISFGVERLQGHFLLDLIFFFRF